VAMVVVFFPASDDEPSLQPSALDELLGWASRASHSSTTRRSRVSCWKAGHSTHAMRIGRHSPSQARARAYGCSSRSCKWRSRPPPCQPSTVQHVRLGPNAPTGWHTHPGPALVTVVKGDLTYEDAKASTCNRVMYAAGEGFVDRGFGHVHRAIAGAAGVDFYVVYLLPPGTATHVIPASAPAECSS
jgi:hypothetical protein